MKTNLKLQNYFKGMAIIMMFILIPFTIVAQKTDKHQPGKRSQGAKPVSSPGNSNKSEVQRPTNQNNQQVKNGENARVSTGDKTNVSGNTVNVDNSKKNVNINVDNSKSVNVNKTTVVRTNPRPYPRPPYAYGGHSYYSYHPYHYHPYHPYTWGAVWHPCGFFITTLAATAIIVSVANQKYHYDQGVYYIAGNGGYTVVQAPVGATITTLPPGSQTVIINETTNNYYYGGTYYEKSGDSYTVVPPTAGVIVENLPEGGQEVKIGEIKYVKVGDTYYQPIEKDGKSLYEVVDVKEDK
ncbi:MAG: DUF6515 family protein [Bacteroidota bacterium]